MRSFGHDKLKVKLCIANDERICATFRCCHYDDVILSVMASRIISVSIVYSTVCPRADQRKHQSFASLAFVRGIHQWPGNSPHKGPVTRKMFPLMTSSWLWNTCIMLNGLAFINPDQLDPWLKDQTEKKTVVTILPLPLWIYGKYACSLPDVAKFAGSGSSEYIKDCAYILTR